MADAASYLKSLNEKIWKSHSYSQMHGRHSRRVEGHILARPLTPWEWRKVKSLVRKEGFAARMGTSHFGFALGMSVIRPPTYPGLPYETLLSLERDHLPNSFRREDRQKDWNSVWDAFSALTHEERNLEILKFCGIEMRLDKGYYEY